MAINAFGGYSGERAGNSSSSEGMPSLTDTLVSLAREIIGSSELKYTMPTVWIQLRCQSHVLIPELLKVINASNAAERVSYAYMLLLVNEHCPSANVGDWTADRCVEALNLVLCDSNSEPQLLACRVLAHGPVPPGCVSSLRKLAHTDTSHPGVLASAALTWHDIENDTVIRQLEYGLLQQDDGISIEAARALVRLSHVSKRAKSIIMSALDSDSEPCVDTLIAIAEARRVDVDLVDAIAGIVPNHARATAVRGLAAHTLGVCAHDIPAALRTLDQVLQSEDLFLVDHALSGCRSLGSFPDGSAERFASWLGHPSDAHHEVALRALAMMRGSAAPALPALLPWIGSDLRGNGPGLLANALAACGHDALPHIITILRSQDLSGASVCSAALVAMGSEAVPAIELLLSGALDPQTLGMILAVVRELGPECERIVPMLNRLLLAEVHDGLLGLLLKALGATGAAADGAMPGLLRCLLVGGDAVATEAEKILRGIGPRVLPVLVDVSGHASESQARRIQRIVQDWDIMSDPRFQKYLVFDDDACLERFVYAAEYLCEHGPTSHRAMAAAFHGRKCAGLMDWGCSTSERSLGLAFQKIREEFGVVVTTQRDGRKGGITSEGQSLLAEVKEYLRHRRLRNASNA